MNRLYGSQPDEGGLIPALAGTTGRRPRQRGDGGAHPRAGGDDPTVLSLGLRTSGSSPRWRGRLLLCGCGQCRLWGLIPALAGTTTTLAPRSNGCRRAHPRAGGDDMESPVADPRPEARGSSPRWRGRPMPSSWIDAVSGAAHPRAGGDDNVRCHTFWPRRRLIPALAGTTFVARMSAPAGSSPRWRGRSRDRALMAGRGAHPRAGGDDIRRHCVGLVKGSSPRWRGRPQVWSERVRGACPAAGIIPALAGTTTATARRWSRARAHPRAGGDDIPRWRYATPLRAHPRAGGDDIFARSSRGGRGGSSPRWRGRHPPTSGSGRSCKRGLIPALAGTTPRSACPDRRRWGSSPRWRGRPPAIVGPGNTVTGLIPALAGTTIGTRRSTDARTARGLIPALAGTTADGSGGPHGVRAHPRAGGDDPAKRSQLSIALGSSPRWRGRPPPRSGHRPR